MFIWPIFSIAECNIIDYGNDKLFYSAKASAEKFPREKGNGKNKTDVSFPGFSYGYK